MPTALGHLLGLVLLAGPAGAAQAPFPHLRHFQAEVSCGDCHLRDEQTKILKPPTQGSCDRCHDKQPVQLAAPTHRQRLKWAFPHEAPAHTRACTECHARTADMPAPPGTLPFNTATCFGCHDRRGADTPEARCAPCHGRDQGKKRPGWHAADPDTWRSEHGAFALSLPPDAHAQSCFQCHDLGVDDPKSSSECKSCHQHEKPLSHRAHLEDRGVYCEQCHTPAVADAPPGIRVETCKTCHQQGELQTTRIRGQARPMRVAFSHAPHAQVSCGSCHASTVEDRHVADTPILTQADCVACHQARDAQVSERSCARCHGVDQRQQPPPSHERAWRIRHSLQADRLAVASHGSADCTQCHGINACDDCHRTVRPASHTAWWRDRTHGIAAEWGREACTTCHETGTCEACHRSTTPLNHRGGWAAVHGLVAASRDNNRCATCHQPSWCASCHRSQ